MDPSQSDSTGKQRPTEVLEVEDDEQRHERIHGLFARLNADSPRSKSATGPDPSPRPLDLGDRNTSSVGPPLELLSRVRAFLPELAASNADLLRRAREDPSSVDIESVGTDQQQYVEMSLGLGVFEHRGDPRDVPAGIPVVDVDLDVKMATDASDAHTSSHSRSAFASVSSHSSTSESASSDDSDASQDSDPDSDSDAGSDSDVEVILEHSAHAHALDADVGAPAASRPIRPLPRRSGKPAIVVLAERSDRGGT